MKKIVLRNSDIERSLVLQDADSIMSLIEDYSDYNVKEIPSPLPQTELTKIKQAIAELPQTDFTKTIPVTVYDAKSFLAQIEILEASCEVTNNTYERDHYRTLRIMACRLFHLPVNLTDPATQSQIEKESYGKV